MERKGPVSKTCKERGAITTGFTAAERIVRRYLCTDRLASIDENGRIVRKSQLLKLTRELSLRVSPQKILQPRYVCPSRSYAEALVPSVMGWYLAVWPLEGN